MALLADVYVNTRATVIGQKAPEVKSAKVATEVTSGRAMAGQNSRGGREGHYQAGLGGFSGHQSLTQAQNAMCYNCGELGHISRECLHKRADAHDGPPSPPRLGQIKCHNCAGWGHISRDCASEPSGRRGGSRGSWRGRYCGSTRGDERNRGVRVNLVSTDGTTT